MIMLEDKDKLADPTVLIYYLIRYVPSEKENTAEAIGLAKSTQGKSFMLIDEEGRIVDVEAERISRSEFQTWSAMKLYPVFPAFHRGHVVIHRCRRVYGKKSSFGGPFEE